jgi:caffeoyl-CoA O-methyltransferase
MNFINPAIEAYSLDHSQPETDALKKLNRDTNAKVLLPRMLSGHMQGNFLMMISNMIKPSRVLEIGTYTGYSAICLADGLQPEGKLYTIDINEELENLVTEVFVNAGVSTKIEQLIGNALDIIPMIDDVFDLVFIDADKRNYAAYYDLVIDKIPVGGYIIADNVLWSGKIIDKPADMDEDTKMIDLFNKKVHNDPRVVHCLLPLRDGLMVARKL